MENFPLNLPAPVIDRCENCLLPVEGPLYVSCRCLTCEKCNAKFYGGLNREDDHRCENE